jgi:Zn-dependent protease
MTHAIQPESALSSFSCAGCGSDVAASMLACPACHQLVHAATLKQLRVDAETAAARGDSAAELAGWQSAAALLPADSRQYAAIAQRIDALSRVARPAGSAPAELPTTGPWKWVSGLGTAGVVLWKIKFLLVALATKGKLLVLGLTKASTLLSMFLAFGVYWTAWGMWFAAGFVLSIYVHEMGHVAALRRYGVPASAPMFIPGLGAYIRLQAQRLPPHEDARIGLAGPMWGLGAGALSFAATAIGGPIFAAIAHTGAWINLFNLLPVWQLDGNRGFAALTRSHRWVVAGAFGIAWWLSGEGLLALLTIAAAVRALDPHAPDAPDHRVAAQFVFLIFALTALARMSALQ